MPISSYIGKVITGLNLRHECHDKFNFEKCFISGICTWNAKFIDCVFKDCVFSKIEVMNSVLNNCKFVGCIFVDFTTPVVCFQGVTFLQCYFYNSSWGQPRKDATNLNFIECRFNRLIFLLKTFPFEVGFFDCSCLSSDNVLDFDAVKKLKLGYLLDSTFRSLGGVVDGIVFSNCRIQSTGTKFVNCKFTNCNFGCSERIVLEECYNHIFLSDDHEQDLLLHGFERATAVEEPKKKSRIAAIIEGFSIWRNFSTEKFMKRLLLTVAYTVLMCIIILGFK